MVIYSYNQGSIRSTRRARLYLLANRSLPASEVVTPEILCIEYRLEYFTPAWFVAPYFKCIPRSDDCLWAVILFYKSESKYF